MSARRVLVTVGVAVSALVLQLTVVTRLPFPGDVEPDLVLVAVVALALANGPLPGAVTGFATGLAADIAPPADHTIGRYALVLCVVGYLCGLILDDLEGSGFTPFAAMALGVLGGALLYVGVGAILGDPRVTLPAVTRVLPVSVLYDVVLSPFVLYAVVWLIRRVDPHPVGYDLFGSHLRYR